MITRGSNFTHPEDLQGSAFLSTQVSFAAISMSFLEPSYPQHRCCSLQPYNGDGQLLKTDAWQNPTGSIFVCFVLFNGKTKQHSSSSPGKNRCLKKGKFLCSVIEDMTTLDKYIWLCSNHFIFLQLSIWNVLQCNVSTSCLHWTVASSYGHLESYLFYLAFFEYPL